MTRSTMTKFVLTAYSAVIITLTMVSADLIAAPRTATGAMRAAPMGPAMAPPMGAGMSGAMDTGAKGTMDPVMAPGGDYGDPPSPSEVLPPDEHTYRQVRLEVRKIIWFAPGQRGLIEAHPLVMGLAAMALATVTLLFFFLRGVKRPKDGDI